ncbi:hypothetical protein [Photobacterium kagoshimensis]|uniref:hypothetical protein n=1 Tax=Photobacterium kagoshimensis TaxID=2910242 RepID=UPI003D0B3055
MNCKINRFKTLLQQSYSQLPSHEFRKFKYFPKACCVLTSHLLARFLIRELSCNNVNVVHGERPDGFWHYWVETDGKIIDITMRQFEEPLEDIIFGDSSWHSECTILEKWSAKWSFDDVDEGADSASKAALEHAYQQVMASF